MLSAFAPAKVNLYLHVTGRRDDGYHLLNSLAVFPNVGDQLTATPAALLSLAITGPQAGTLAAEPDNLVLRAARRLAANRGAALTLTKNLPVASGIGGGSADAAAALRLLAKFWALDTPLESLALPLGADVPVCLDCKPAHMSGIGEILAPAPLLPAFGILLANPGFACKTPDIFRAREGQKFSPSPTLPAGWYDARAMAADLHNLQNDLQAPAILLQPTIGEVISAISGLPGCLLARMSGSGATCFGIFHTPATAISAAAQLGQPNWWSWAGGLYEPSPTDL